MNFRRFPTKLGLGLAPPAVTEWWAVEAVPPRLVLAEVSARATRRGEGSVGEGEVDDHTRSGVGGVEGTEALHVREQTTQVGVEQLENNWRVN